MESKTTCLLQECIFYGVNKNHLVTRKHGVNNESVVTRRHVVWGQ
jgi:hypothetical protein